MGPDRFPIAADDRLRAIHLSLNDYLLAAEQAESIGSNSDMNLWKKLPKRQIPDHIEAVLRRVGWLYANDRELANAHLARQRLMRLLRTFYTVKLPCTEPELRMMLDLTAPLLEHIAPDGPVEYVTEYLKKNDLTKELCDSLRTFNDNVRTDVSGMAALQSLKQRLHMLLWLDEWEPLNPARCWSECIRRDFRLMAGDRRIQWRRLLAHLRGNAPPRMPAGWARDAEQYLAAVGIDDFRQQLGMWFAPFRSGEPLPLSVAGSHVLKGLIWYASLTRDDEVRDIALWLLDVKWKQKRNVEKAMLALEVFGISKEEMHERGLVKPLATAADPMARLMDKLLRVEYLHAPDRMAEAGDDDLIIVQGQLHFYRLFRSSGRIERATDNRVIELDWHALPDSQRSMVGPLCDSEEQLRVRGLMLMNDAFYARFFTVKGKGA